MSGNTTPLPSMRDPNETTGICARSRSFGSQSPAKRVIGSRKTESWTEAAPGESIFDRDVADVENKPRIDLPTVIAVDRPDLLQPFDSKSYERVDFCFAPILRYPFQKKPRTLRKPATRAAARKATRRKEEAVKLSKLYHDTAELREAFESYQKNAKLPSQESPRKKSLRQAPHTQEEAEFDGDWEHAKEHGDYRMSWAKADVRNHLLDICAPETRRNPSTTDFGPAPVLKRRADGTSRANWIRQKQVDPDVKYLLTFPGEEMGAEKAFNLLGRKEMLTLDTVEEASNDSLVMPEDPPSTATHVSEENRLARLEAAKSQFPVPCNTGQEDSIVADDAAHIDEYRSTPTIMEPFGATIYENTSVQDKMEDKDAQISCSVSASPSHVTDKRRGHASADSNSGDEPAVPDAEPPKDDDDNRIRTFKDPSFLSNTTFSHSSFISPEQPSTPRAQTPSAHQILDIDLNKNSDIFASALLQNRNIKVAPTGVSHLSFATPQPSSPPPSMKSQVSEIDHNSRWSPLAESPTPSSPTPSVASADPIQSSVNISLRSDEEKHEEPAALTSIEALANLVSPIQQISNTRVVLGQNEDRFFIRFKLPEKFAENFLEHAEHLHLEKDLKQEDPAVEGELVSEILNREIEKEPAEEEIKIISEDDPRDLLRQFVTKHQAGKAKPSPVPFSGGAVSPPATKADTVKTDSPTRSLPIFPAESPKTPEARTEHVPMWIETPTFSMTSDQPAAETPIRNSSSKKRSRTPLGQLDANSPSPVKSKTGKRQLEDDDGQKDLEKKSPEPSPKRRRGLRARKPATPGPDTAPTNSRLVRNGEKDLASMTRANTRANKGSAQYPADVLAQFAEDPLGQQWKERKAVVDARAARSVKVGGKNVHWPEALASYQNFTSNDAEDAGDAAATDAPAAAAHVPEDSKDEEKPKKSRTVKSKLPAPVGRPRRAASGPVAPATPRPATPKVPAAKRAVSAVAEGEETNVGRRPTRAAAQKTNIKMGLTATGTPVRRRPTRSTAN